MNKIPPFFLSISLLYTTLTLTSTTSNTIPLNSTLSTSNPTQTWTSPNNTFSLQFLRPESPSRNPNTSTFSLSITYGSFTPIWTAPVTTDTGITTGSTVILHSSGDLRLISDTGSILWHSNTSNLGVTHAVLAESGNFMLMNMSDDVIWESFENPADVIVPGQNFTVGMELASGVYTFFLKSTGNLKLEWNHSIVYYYSGLNSSVTANLSGNPSLKLTEDGILKLNDINLTPSVSIAYSSDYGETGEMLRFLRLDNDGNLRLYRVDKGSDNPGVRWSAVSNQCLVFGYCGNMGICSYNETDPVCGCPSQNFELVDDSNVRKGCKLKEEIENCSSSATLLEMDNTMFLNYPPELNDVYYMGSTTCRGNCLSGASCVASTTLADGSGQCYIKSSNFVSGYKSATLPSTSFVKVCGPVEPNPPPPSDDTSRNKKLKSWIIGVVILATIVVLLLLEGTFWWWCCRKSQKFASLSAQYALLEYASGAPVQFSYKELRESTRGFEEKLGEGGFGAVYKGVLANKTVSAVKQLEGIEQGEKQFRMEVATISSTHHLNLVRLIGFCSEGKHRLLVYEFMKNGSLDSFLFRSDSNPEKFLSWENRFNILLGTVKGITYLHEECRDCIVHCDIKPENILLDDNYNAKVSDFGLAKLVNPKDHRYRTLTSVRGTRGYLAPEWLANHPITSKSDVYSFGMVLLEIVSGKRNFEVSDETGRKKFSIWAYEEFDKGNLTALLDRRLGGPGEVDMGQVSRAVEVGFWCIQEQPSQRPMMGKVVQMLEGIIEIQRPPAPKAPTDGSISGTSLNISSVSGRSTFGASGFGPSSSSASMRAPSSFSGMNVDKPGSSLVHREA